MPRVRLPKTTKAMKMPRKMLSTVSHRIPMPNTAAAPPKPTMAAVEMKVDP